MPREKRSGSKDLVNMFKKVENSSLDHIVPQLHPLAIDMSLITLDVENANKHPKDSIDSIAASLAKFKQRKPVVCQKIGDKIILRAGEGNYLALRKLGHSMIAAVVVEEDNLNAQGYGIADNQTARRSKWDPKTLDSVVKKLHVEKFDLKSLGFKEKDLSRFTSKELPAEKLKKPKEENKKQVQCPKCSHSFEFFMLK